MSPILFGLIIELFSEQFEIIQTYGTPYDEENKKESTLKAGELFNIDTLVGSDIDKAKGVKGGIVLVEIKDKSTYEKGKANAIILKINFEDKDEKKQDIALKLD